MKKLSWASLLACSVMTVGCSVGHTSAVIVGPSHPEWTGEVTISAIRTPLGATETGIVQVSGQGNLEALMPGLIDKVRAIGGNWLVVDKVTAKPEMVTTTQTTTYSCGTAKAPATCTGTQTVTHELLTTSIVGRAFLTEGGAE